MGSQSNMYRVHRFLIGIFAVLISCNAFASVSECPASAQAFWDKFRGASLDENLKTVANQSYFPFRVKGTLDDSKEKRLNRQKFLKLFPQLLITDPGTSESPTTMKALLTATPKLLPTHCNSQGNQFRVGAWVFELKTEKWGFVQAFVDE